jgi:hypothetical protein
VQKIKRETGYGSIAVTNDQATQDILTSINERKFEFWRYFNWTFSLNAVVITTVSNQQDYTLAALDGPIIDLWGRTTMTKLRRYSNREYLQWVADPNQSGEDLGGVFGYVEVGRDSSDRAKIRLVHTPENTGDVIDGFSKKRLTTYAVADIATNTLIEFFPAETHGILLTGSKADIYEILKNENASARHEAKFKAALQLLVGQEGNMPDRRINIRLPSMYRRRKRNRARGGTGVA